jgi:hypothetical protein
MDKKINQADKLMRQNGAIQTSKTNSWTLREIKYFLNKHGFFFLKNIPAQYPRSPSPLLFRLQYKIVDA